MRSDTVLILLHFAEILHYLEKIAFVRFILVCLGHWSTGSRVAVLGNSMKRSIVTDITQRGIHGQLANDPYFEVPQSRQCADACW